MKLYGNVVIYSCSGVVSNQGIIALLTCLSCVRMQTKPEPTGFCSNTSVAYECALSQSVTTMQAYVK